MCVCVCVCVHEGDPIIICTFGTSLEQYSEEKHDKSVDNI